MDLKEIALNKSNKRHPWELARIDVVKHFIRGMSGLNKKELTILDVGSGDTYLIKELSEEFGNASFYAIDIGYDQAYIDSTNKEFALEQTKIRVYNNMAAAEEEIKAPVDLVLLLDVIEHVPDDIQFLKELSRFKRITDQTVFLITVPSYQSLFCSHDVFLGHYRRYNNKLLQKNVSEAGLKVVDIGYFFTFPLVPRFIKVAMEKRSKAKNEAKGIGNWEGGALTSKLLKGMLTIDFSVSAFLRRLGVKLPGLSNFAVCKRFV